MEKSSLRECPHCREQFEIRKTDGLNISCKECDYFYKQHAPFKLWKQLRNSGERNYFSY